MRRMRQDVFVLPDTLVQAAQAVAEAEQMSLDDCVRLVIAEQIAAARTAQYVRPCAAQAEPQACLVVLERMQQAAGPAHRARPRGGRRDAEGEPTRTAPARPL